MQNKYDKIWCGNCIKAIIFAFWFGLWKKWKQHKTHYVSRKKTLNAEYTVARVCDLFHLHDIFWIDCMLRRNRFKNSLGLTWAQCRIRCALSVYLGFIWQQLIFHLSSLHSFCRSQNLYTILHKTLDFKFGLHATHLIRTYWNWISDPCETHSPEYCVKQHTVQCVKPCIKLIKLVHELANYCSYVCVCTWWSLKILTPYKPIAVQFFNSLFAIHIQEIIDTEFAHLSIASIVSRSLLLFCSFALLSLLCASHFHSIYTRALLIFLLLFVVCCFIRYDWLRWQFVLLINLLTGWLMYFHETVSAFRWFNVPCRWKEVNLPCPMNDHLVLMLFNRCSCRKTVQYGYAKCNFICTISTKSLPIFDIYSTYWCFVQTK